MFAPPFTHCDVTRAQLFLISLEVVYFFDHLVIMVFKQISAEAKRVIVCCNEKKSQTFIAENPGTSSKGVQGVLKR